MAKRPVLISRVQAHLDQLHWKALAKSAASRLGYCVHRVDPVVRTKELTDDPFVDQKRLVEFASTKSHVTVFDVGANVGQSVLKYRETFPTARIHSFEPLPKAFRQLHILAEKDGNTVANRLALDASIGKREFLSNRGGANQTSCFSSFLPPAAGVEHSFPAHAFELDQVIEVETSTLDSYCAANSVDTIDVLKMDTQGTELDVLRGAVKQLERGAILVVYIEVTFAPVYDGGALYHDVAAFLDKHGMDLFRIHYLNYGTAGRIIGGDAIFVRRDLLRSFLDSAVEISPPK